MLLQAPMIFEIFLYVWISSYLKKKKATLHEIPGLCACDLVLWISQIKT